MTYELSLPRVDRRTLLKASAIGGFLLGFRLPLGAQEVAGSAGFSPNAFIRIDPQGMVTLVMPMVEMGQGIYTGQAMLLAEELEVGLDQVKLEPAPPAESYVNPMIHEQITAGSTSIRAWAPILRQAGAATRTMLVSTAAQEWGVDASTCRAERGMVHHAASGRSLGYGVLAGKAATKIVPLPETVKLKDPKDFILIGTKAKRLDTPDKTNGRAQFGLDVQLPGLKIAAVAMSPVSGGKPTAFNKKAALAVNGVRQVIKLDDVIAVIADHTGAARKGVMALDVQWDDGPNAKINSATLIQEIVDASLQSGAVARQEGDVDKALSGAAHRIEAVYHQPFLAHATMEPMNCTVHVRQDACDVWIGTQAPGRVQAVAAKLTGLPITAVTVHGYYLGGGFGRRSEIDYVAQAVSIACHVNGPVKLVWSREDDIRHDMYRPHYVDRIEAGLDSTGKPIAWTHRITGSSFLARLVPTLLEQTKGVDPDAVEGATELLYAPAAIRVEFKRLESPGVSTTWWRGVGPARNAYVVESFIDELAAALRKDTVAYRRSLIGHEPRAMAVLNLAAEKAGWGGSMASGRGRGVALMPSWGGYMAQIAEVEVTPEGVVRVLRVTCAVDCGLIINPDTVVAQVEGGIVFGISAALYGVINFKNGRVEEGNFDDYPVLRMDEMPRIDVHLVQSTEASGGIGEAGTACIVPAITNAVFAATGRRIRNLPISVS